MATLLSVWIAGLALSGCSEQELPGEPVAPSKPAKALRFGVADMKISSRASQTPGNVYETEFNEDNKIGCVIAEKTADNTYVYRANTVWRYRKGYLILIEEDIFNEEGNDTRHAYEVEDLSVEDYTDVYDKTFTYIRRLKDNSNFPNAKDEDLELLQDFDYAFFFYYPYISDKEMAFDYQTHSGYDTPGSVETPFSKTMFPGFPKWSVYHSFENFQYIYPMAPPGEKQRIQDYNKNQQWERHSWRRFAAFVSESQITKRQSELSDFMWTKYVVDYNDNSQPINKTTATYKVPLTFKKKFAAIQINSETPLYSVFIQGSSNTFKDINEGYPVGTKYEKGGIRQGKCLDLQTGTMIDYNPIYWNSNWQVVEHIYSYASWFSDVKNTDGLLPPIACVNDRKFNPYPNADKTSFWQILPPQEKFEANLHFKFKEDGAEYVINLGEKLHELEENKLYIINLTPVGWDIIINDWIDDKQGVLIENEPREPQNKSTQEG